MVRTKEYIMVREKIKNNLSLESEDENAYFYFDPETNQKVRGVNNSNIVEVSYREVVKGICLEFGLSSPARERFVFEFDDYSKVSSIKRFYQSHNVTVSHWYNNASKLDRNMLERICDRITPTEVFSTRVEITEILNAALNFAKVAEKITELLEENTYKKIDLMGKRIILNRYSDNSSTIKITAPGLEEITVKREVFRENNRTYTFT